MKDWFKEQDQLKLDRAARLAEETQPAADCSFTEAHQIDIDADGLDESLEEVSCIDNGGDGVGKQTSPAAATVLNPGVQPTPEEIPSTGVLTDVSRWVVKKFSLV